MSEAAQRISLCGCGNMIVGASSTLTYDVDNRILTATGNSMEWYGYNAGNKRVWKKRKVSNLAYEELIYAYASTGQKVMSMTLTDASGTLSVAVKDTYLYFGGRMVKEGPPKGRRRGQSDTTRWNKRFPVDSKRFG